VLSLKKKKIPFLLWNAFLLTLFNGSQAVLALKNVFVFL
jgi:hypothetical protein